MGAMVGEIQNRGLSDHRIRELNDEINKLIRDKGRWEQRILELGGPNYGSSKKSTNINWEYQYFGAARYLNGVKELFEKEASRTLQKTRHNLYQNIGAYY